MQRLTGEFFLWVTGIMCFVTFGYGMLAMKLPMAELSSAYILPVVFAGHGIILHFFCWIAVMKNDVKILRAAMGWSQEELAKNLGVSRQAVNAIERGKHDPSLTLAFAIATVFEKPIEAIFNPEI
jgi:putative transcriptional regulator